MFSKWFQFSPEMVLEPLPTHRPTVPPTRRPTNPPSSLVKTLWACSVNVFFASMALIGLVIAAYEREQDEAGGGTKSVGGAWGTRERKAASSLGAGGRDANSGSSTRLSPAARSRALNSEAMAAGAAEEPLVGPPTATRGEDASSSGPTSPISRGDGGGGGIGSGDRGDGVASGDNR